MKRSAQLVLLSNGLTIDITPAAITATSGSGQSANCGAAYAAPLVATVTNAGGVGVPGVSVTFTAPASGASGAFASTGTNVETVVTDATGKATSSVFTANTTGGVVYNVTAVAGALSCNFSLTNNWTVYSYAGSLTPLGDWRMRDTSGVTVVNSGSLGSAVDLTATAWTMAQAGQLGAGEAGLADGATTLLTCANNATLGNLTAFEYVFLVRPSSAGEGNNGDFLSWGAPGAGDNEFRYYSATTKLGVILNDTVPSVYITITTTAPANNVWQLIFFAFDNSGDRKAHIYKGVSGAVSEFGYSAQPAMTGTFRAQTGALSLMNRPAQTITFAGLCDWVLIFSGNLTPAQRSTLTTLVGV